jgi:maltooligosyltrehalose trehalohydrolase
MLFQGQEFSASAPFLYFADPKPELQAPITDGRREFLAQFASLRDPEVQEALPSPVASETFERSKLDPAERESNAGVLALHTDLIALRRSDPVIARPHATVDGAVLAPSTLLLRYFGGPGGDRLLIVNLGRDMDLTPAPEPLLAAPSGAVWNLHWSSEAVRYGGHGTPPLDPAGAWRLPGECALLFTSEQGQQE